MLFCFIPANNIALGSMSKANVQNASGLFNLMRNLGGAIGIAAISNSIMNNNRIFNQYFNENISYSSPYGANALLFFNQLLSTSGKVNDPTQASYLLLSNLVNTNGFIMAINNVFFTISILFFISLLFLPLMSKVTYTGNNANAH
jgi:DHA2 family multidrug resistance protein